MDLDSYVGKRCKIELTNSFYFEGKVIQVLEDSIILIDKKGQRVTLPKTSIFLIREVSNGSN